MKKGRAGRQESTQLSHEEAPRLCSASAFHTGFPFGFPSSCPCWVQLAGMNARLAYVEGRQDELGAAWKEALGPAGEIVGDIGPDLAAAAGTRVVEIELKKAPDRKPLELMQ